jgi:hypothetical protein
MAFIELQEEGNLKLLLEKGTYTPDWEGLLIFMK